MEKKKEPSLVHHWLSPGREWCVDGSQKSLDKRVVVKVPAEPWLGLRHDPIKPLNSAALLP